METGEKSGSISKFQAETGSSPAWSGTASGMRQTTRVCGFPSWTGTLSVLGRTLLGGPAGQARQGPRGGIRAAWWPL